MRSLWFIVPANGRVDLTRVCLRQLRRCCDTLADYGVTASAVVIADDENLETADALGFATVERENDPLGSKFNDGYELAGVAGVDYAMPLGSDDWVDPVWVAGMFPAPNEIRCSRHVAIVHPDRDRMSLSEVGYIGGHGIRMIPAGLLELVEWRPCDEDRNRALDRSAMEGIALRLGRHPKVVYYDIHQCQVVDWKSDTNQLNRYEDLGRYRNGSEVTDPFHVLAGIYPDESLDEMRELSAVTV